MMIESLQNERIKNLIRLNTDNRFRKKSGVFVVEGKQENERALMFGFEPEEFFICESIFQGEPPEARTTVVSDKVYEKIAYRGDTEGIVGIYRSKENRLEDFKPKDNASVIIVEGAEKPGNIGAILRSCEAFRIDALIITDSKVDFYNPNVIRSSVGCLFGMNIFTATNEETRSFLQNNQFEVYTTYMSETAKPVFEADLKKRSAIIFGTEHSGISDFWLQDTQNILIPMAGTIDSLNLSNAVAISCYEILRQKNNK